MAAPERTNELFNDGISSVIFIGSFVVTGRSPPVPPYRGGILFIFLLFRNDSIKINPTTICDLVIVTSRADLFATL